ncbi:MAG TPA: transcription termination/antitermination NusG family protein [Planctomycetota bacterium]|jgi:transcription antitermination factor NusG
MLSIYPAPRPLASPLPDVERWCVLHTRARSEKVVARVLEEQRVPFFLPLLRKRNVGHRQVRIFEVPLFAGYVFSDASALNLRPVRRSFHVTQILEPDDPEELRRDLSNLALALQYDDSLTVFRYSKPGRPVCVVRSALKGLQGEMVRIKSQTRLIIRVHFLSQAASLEIDESLVEPEL